MAGDANPSSNFQLPSLIGALDAAVRMAPYPMNPEEEQRWLARRDEQRTESSLPLLPPLQQPPPILNNDPSQPPYHQYAPSPGYLRQPAPLRPQSWGYNGPLPNLGSNSMSSSSSSTNSYIPNAQSNSFNQSYQPLPYPSPVSPAFSIPNQNSHNSNASGSSSSGGLLPSSNLHSAFQQPMLPGNWSPSLPIPKLQNRDNNNESSSLPPRRESFPGMYEKTDDHSSKQPAPVTPMVSSTPGGGPQTAVKPFAAKLAFLLANPNLYADLIMWDEAGTCFILAHSVERLSEEVLPLLFSHNSSTAFRRQLNIYNFVHLTSQQLTKKFRNSTISVPIKHCSGWQHPYFTKDNPSTLHLLRPKPSRARRLHQLSREKKVLENVMERNRDQERAEFGEGEDYEDEEGESGDGGNAEASGSGHVPNEE